jgi:glycosyltransferase involved in cell wall biosynthesis
MNKLKILMITIQNPFVRSDAPSNRFLTLAEGMVEKGVSIDLLFLNGYLRNDEKEQFKSSGIYKSINYKYLLYFDYSNFIIRNIINRLVPRKFFVNRIAGMIKDNSYDYVWMSINQKMVNIGLDIFKKKLNTKFIHERSEFSWIGFSGEKIHQKYLTRFLPNVDVFAIMTSTLINYYKDYTGEKTKIVHVPMTVDFSRFDGVTVNSEQKKLYIAYCGTMNIKKDGVDVLINSFIKIMDDFPELYLYIAGPLIPKPDYVNLKNIVIKNKAQDRILFLGSIPKEEMPGFLTNAHILAMARPQSKQAEGGFPTKLGEYLATGKPVCVTNVGEIGNYLKNNESVFMAEPDSVNSFADALKRALTDKNAIEIGHKGRNVAFENFNKDIQTNKLYKFLLQNRE